VKPCQNVKGNIPIDIPASRHQAMNEQRKLVLAGPYTGRTRNTGLTQHRAIHYGDKNTRQARRSTLLVFALKLSFLS